MKNICGRGEEKNAIIKAFSSSKSELVAVYGRRRVGKTFLVRQSWENFRKGKENIKYLELTGSIHESGKVIGEDEFIQNFNLSWINAFGESPRVTKLDEIFEQLVFLAKKAKENEEILILFLDEFPWICQINPRVYNKIVFLWNNIFEGIGNVKLCIAGSSTSWILDNIINSKAGFAKRFTYKLKLKPFTLKETALFLKDKGFNIPPSMVCDVMIALGGIPYYLEALEPAKSIPENLWKIFCAATGRLSGENEYQNMFRYLFGNNSIPVIPAPIWALSGVNSAGTVF